MTEATVAKKKAPAKAKTATKSAPKKAPKEKVGKLAVFATGGKQYAVYEGDTVNVEILTNKEYKEGDSVAFTDVLLVVDGSDVKLGTPFVSGLAVSGTISKIGKAKKIEVIKYRSKSRYFKRNGHRQPFFEIKIGSIK